MDKKKKKINRRNQKLYKVYTSERKFDDVWVIYRCKLSDRFEMNCLKFRACTAASFPTTSKRNMREEKLSSLPSLSFFFLFLFFSISVFLCSSSLDKLFWCCRCIDMKEVSIYSRSRLLGWRASGIAGETLSLDIYLGGPQHGVDCKCYCAFVRRTFVSLGAWERSSSDVARGARAVHWEQLASLTARLVTVSRCIDGSAYRRYKAWWTNVSDVYNWWVWLQLFLPFRKNISDEWEASWSDRKREDCKRWTIMKVIKISVRVCKRSEDRCVCGERSEICLYMKYEENVKWDLLKPQSHTYHTAGSAQESTLRHPGIEPARSAFSLKYSCSIYLALLSIDTYVGIKKKWESEQPIYSYRSCVAKIC